MSHLIVNSLVPPYKEDSKTLCRYVCQCLKQENVGIVNVETVHDILLNSISDDNESLDYKDTVGFIDAYRFLHKLSTDQDAGLMERNLICDVHKILMKHRAHLCTVGKYSEKERITEFEGTIHYYTRCRDIEHTMQILFDEFNRRLDAINRNRKKNEKEALFNLVRLTSWFVYTFLETHPFSDGNGRLCRVLFTFIMEAYGFPFPTPLFWYSKEEIRTKDSNQEYRSWCTLLSNIRLTHDFSQLENCIMFSLKKCCKTFLFELQ